MIDIIERGYRAVKAAEAFAEVINDVFGDMDDHEKAATIMATTMLLMQSTAAHCGELNDKDPRDCIATMAEESMKAFPERVKKPEDLPTAKVAKKGPSPWSNVR